MLNMEIRKKWEKRKSTEYKGSSFEQRDIISIYRVACLQSMSLIHPFSAILMYLVSLVCFDSSRYEGTRYHTVSRTSVFLRTLHLKKLVLFVLFVLFVLQSALL